MESTGKVKIKLSELTDMYDIEDDSDKVDDDTRKAETKSDLDLEIEIEDKKIEEEFE